MSVEGLRAWIGEVERKLRMRTRVFLALAVIAIGLGGAAIYLAIDTRESSVSEGDVQALQQELETRIDEAAAAPTTTPEAEAPEAETAPTPQPEEAPGAGAGHQSQSGNGAGGAGGSATAIPPGATGGAPSAAQLQKRVEEALRAHQEAEAGHGGK